MPTSSLAQTAPSQNIALTPSLNGPPSLAIKPAKSGSPEEYPYAPAAPTNKMAMSAVVSPSTGSDPGSDPGLRSTIPGSMTSKEWVLPPRNKPGRKPKTDTPPTKRKAQNRAAQRAFRERRAARVGELEEQLEEQKEEHMKLEGQLRDRIQGLEAEAQSLRSRGQMLETVLEKEREDSRRVNGELESLKRRWNDGTHAIPQAQNQGMTSTSATLAAMPGQPRQHLETELLHTSRHSLSRQSSHQNSIRDIINDSTPTGGRPPTQAFSISQIISPPDDVDTPALTCGSCGPNGICSCAEEAISNSMLGCGKCILGSRCECLEAELKSAEGGTSPELKRPMRSTSPSSLPPDEKRHRSGAMETDFTASFAHKKRSSSTSIQQATPTTYAPVLAPQQQQLGAVPEKDGCGFCKEGTYCVCADAAAAAIAQPLSTVVHHPQAQMTPPPSENDVSSLPMEVTASGAIKLPSRHALPAWHNNKATKLNTAMKTELAPSSCEPSGPGTCAQCRADPKSGLFCRSLAANFARTSSGGCCGSAGPGGCCKTDRSSSVERPALSLSCADAYKTLASHRHFGEAADEIGTWLPLLKAGPPSGGGNVSTNNSVSGGAASGPERLPIEVEAASIMTVLKGFDVRFGT